MTARDLGSTARLVNAPRDGHPSTSPLPRKRSTSAASASSAAASAGASGAKGVRTSLPPRRLQVAAASGALGRHRGRPYATQSRRAREAGLGAVEIVEADAWDTRLPRAAFDLVHFRADVDGDPLSLRCSTSLNAPVGSRPALPQRCDHEPRAER
jgi:hypothetical protein